MVKKMEIRKKMAEKKDRGIKMRKWYFDRY